jgi:hypothetical protein
MAGGWVGSINSLDHIREEKLLTLPGLELRSRSQSWVKKRPESVEEIRTYTNILSLLTLGYGNRGST